MERSAEEIAEIERHKYFLSEKRGYDVGWETAEQDWEENYGDQYRCSTAVKQSTTIQSEHATAIEPERVAAVEPVHATVVEAEPVAAIEPKQVTEDAACSNGSRVVHVDGPSTANSMGPLKRLFSRLLSKTT